VKTTVFGIDFTSAPRRAKAITVARGELHDRALVIGDVWRLESFDAFEAFLETSGPWTGGFDFPFGLPRELVATLSWPEQWRALVQHVRMIGKDEFKSALTRIRESRPVGSKYVERRGDRASGSSSPMKLVNPPVGLMFFEGTPRLANAGVSVFPCAPNDDSRVALEAYPGFLARQITKKSYKKDGKDGNTPSRLDARHTIVGALPEFVRVEYALELTIPETLDRECVSDGSGDVLDAVLCCIQACVARYSFERGDVRYGIPQTAVDFEGWIATVP
jgi:hypothetical protein